MSGNYWRIVAAVVGVTLLSAVTYASYQLYQSSEQQRADYRYQPAREARRVVIMPTKAEPKGYQPDCQNPQGSGNADLCAQWAGVDQVMEANRLASVNVRLALFISLLTLIGTGFVGWTFLETRITSRRELRAYVHVTKGRIRRFEVGRTPRVHIQFKNSGATPANRLNIDATFFFAGPDESAVEVPDLVFEDDPSTSSIGPGDTKSLRYVFAGVLSQLQYDAAVDGASCVYIKGQIRYLDVFGRAHMTNFMLRQNESIGGLSKMSYCSLGNDAT